MPRVLPPGFRGKILSLALAAAALSVGAAAPARAGMILTVQDATAGPGTTGNTLEVDLTNTGTTAVEVAAFNFELTVATGSGVSFNGADINTTQAYIFAGTSFLGPTISGSTGTTLDAADLGVPAASVAAGSTVGLGRVFFDVAGSAAPGPVAVDLTPTLAGTSLTAPDGSNITIDAYNNGTITIAGAAVPEPSGMVLGALGFLGAARLLRGRRTAPR